MYCLVRNCRRSLRECSNGVWYPYMGARFFLRTASKGRCHFVPPVSDKVSLIREIWE